MRILAVTNMRPWPTTRGGKHRLFNVLRTLGDLGEIDLFSFVNAYEAESMPSYPEVLRIRRYREGAAPTQRRGWRAWQLLWHVRGTRPLELVGRDYSAVRAAFLEWRAEAYDLVWFSRPITFEALGKYVDAPIIVDLDDLEHEKASGALKLRSERASRGVGDRISDYQTRRNIERWIAYYHKLSQQVKVACVCSELDRKRLGIPNAMVVPNGYERVEVNQATDRSTHGARIVMQGSLTYAANVDGANWLVREVAPVLRRECSDVSIRLVGRCGAEVRRLADPPEIVVTGFVESMRTELENARLVAVPIRYGGGTRIKILEAFAYGVPVVSTTVGAEGLAVRHGEHLLIADAPEDFARACMTLLTDEALRERLVANGRQLLEDTYTWSNIRDDVAEEVLKAIRPGIQTPV